MENIDWKKVELNKVKFSDLLNKTIISIIGKNFDEISNGKEGDKELIFTTSDNKKYLMSHRQDCCEIVEVEDIIGDLKDLMGSPILLAEETSSEENPVGFIIPEYVKDEKYDWRGGFSWTFYKLATIKGYVTIRWSGTSNGCYSESVDFEEIIETKD